MPKKRFSASARIWLLKKSSFVLHLQYYQKKNTSSREYQSLFIAHTVQHYADWKLFSTDGSKADSYTTFAVVDGADRTVKAGQLPPYCSVYTAEAAAVYNAVLFAVSSNTKTILCTDSKSTVSALQNAMNKSYLMTHIRNILIEDTNIKII